MNIKIAHANYADEKQALDIAYLLDIYAQDTMGGDEALPVYVKENLVAELAKRPYAFSLLAYAGVEPVGLVNCFEGFSSFACKPLINIHDVFVLDGFRGLGISQLLLSEVESMAKERGCCKITLEVLEGNNAAKQSYAKQGFAAYALDPSMGSALFWQKCINTTG